MNHAARRSSRRASQGALFVLCVLGSAACGRVGYDLVSKHAPSTSQDASVVDDAGAGGVKPTSGSGGTTGSGATSAGASGGEDASNGNAGAAQSGGAAGSAGATSSGGTAGSGSGG